MFDELEAAEVVSFTEVHNHRSRAVMERLGIRYSKDIAANDAAFCAVPPAPLCQPDDDSGRPSVPVPRFPLTHYLSVALNYSR